MQFEKIRTAEKLNDLVTKQIKDDDKYIIFLDEIQHVRSQYIDIWIKLV